MTGIVKVEPVEVLTAEPAPLPPTARGLLARLATDKGEEQLDGGLWKPLAAVVDCDAVHGPDQAPCYWLMVELSNRRWVEYTTGQRRRCACGHGWSTRWVRITMAGYQRWVDDRLGVYS